MSDNEALMESVRRALTDMFDQVDAISNDRTASAQAQQARTARSYLSAKSSVDSLRSKLHADRDAKRNELRQRLLDPTSALPFRASTTDRLLATASYRDALDRLVAMDREAVLAQLQQWAVTGDDIGCKACLAEGFRRRDPELVNAVTRYVPEWEEMTDEYWLMTAPAKSEVADLVKEELAIGLPKPDALAGLDEAEIARIAADGMIP